MKKQPKDKVDEATIEDKKGVYGESGDENLDGGQGSDVEEVVDGEKIKEEDFDKCKEYVKKIEDLEKEVASFKDLNLRLQAEFNNFKKRTQKEKLGIYDIAMAEAVSPFLEVLDDLERALSLVEKKDRFSEGIDLVLSKFYGVLKKIGLKEIESLGKVFDPNLHEAIKIVNDEKYEKNVICEVFQKGFVLNDTVVRHSLVVVANP